MNVGGAIVALLATVTSRVYPVVMPQDSPLPAVTYQVISAIRPHAMGGDVSVNRVRVQVNSWGRSYADAITLAGQVDNQLSRYKGTAGKLTVLDVLKDNELDDYDSESQTRRVIQDFTFFISE